MLERNNGCLSKCPKVTSNLCFGIIAFVDEELLEFIHILARHANLEIGIENGEVLRHVHRLVGERRGVEQDLRLRIRHAGLPMHEAERFAVFANADHGKEAR